jgi:GH24 family phage-related lysozyme (muramidase)
VLDLVSYVLRRGDYLEASRQVGVVVEIGSGRIKKRRRRRREEELNV